MNMIVYSKNPGVEPIVYKVPKELNYGDLYLDIDDPDFNIKLIKFVTLELQQEWPEVEKYIRKDELYWKFYNIMIEFNLYTKQVNLKSHERSHWFVDEQIQTNLSKFINWIKNKWLLWRLYGF